MASWIRCVSDGLGWWCRDWWIESGVVLGEVLGGVAKTNPNWIVDVGVLCVWR